MIDTTLIHEAAVRGPRLSPDEEKDLAIRWRDRRDTAARDRLFASQLRCVVWCCHRYRHLHSYDEAISEGCLGLLHAIDKFDPDRGFRLVTYATLWIRQRMQHAIDLRQVPLPTRDASYVKAAIRRGDLDVEVLAKRMHRRRERVQAMVEQLTAPGCYLDEPHNHLNGQPMPLREFVAGPDDHEEALLDQDEHRHKLGLVDAAMGRLMPRERQVLGMRFSRRELTLDEVGKKLGVSRERARQLEARALRKIREAVG